MRRKLHLLLLAGLFALASIQHSYATHAMGMDLFYEHIGPGNIFEITLNFYRDCAGMAAPASATAQVISTTCGVNMGVGLALQPAPPGGREVSPICPHPNTTCSGGSNPGVELYTYVATVDFSNNFCDDWVISYSVCCRNSAITNLVDTANLYVDARMNNSINGPDTLWNNSPQFSSLLVLYICVNQPFNYNNGASDPDQDSLSYYMVNALNSPYPDTIVYNSGYSLIEPVISVPPVNLDPVTGVLSMNPTVLQNSVVTTKIEEWRDVGGSMTMVGSVIRDVQVLVLACANVQPSIPSSGMQGIMGGTINPTDSFTVELCPGDSVSFFFVVSDANADNILMTSNLSPANMPTASFTTSCICPVDTGFFGWRPEASDVGLHTMIVSVQDDGCPILPVQLVAFNILVKAATNAGPDLVYCGDPVQLNATGGSTFTWTVLSGDPIDSINFSCNPCNDPTASPAITTTYRVESDQSGTCGNDDTITVTVAPSFVASAQGDTIICAGVGVPLCAFGDTTYNVYSYSWDNGSTLNSTSDSCVTASPNSTTTYTVAITASSGCRKTATVTVTTNPPAPVVVAWVDSLNGNTMQLCAGDTTRLIASGGAPDLKYSWDNTGSLASPNDSSSLAWPTITTTYTVTVWDSTMADACTGTALTIVYVGPKYNITSVSASPQPLCPGATIQLNVLTDSAFAFNYTWSPAMFLNDPILQNPSASGFDSTTTFIVKLTHAALGCERTDSVTVSLHPKITADAGPNQVICNGDSVQIGGSPSGSGGAGPLSYAWTPGSGISDSMIANPTVFPSTNTTYFLYVSDSNCTQQASVYVQSIPLQTAGVSITADNNPSCLNELVTFLATPVNGGISPTYQWKVNGFVKGNNSQTYITASLVDGDEVFCRMFSTYICVLGSPAVSNTITMTVHSIPGASFTGLDPLYCTTDAPVMLIGNPSGGTFSGPGVVENVFFPNLAPIGLSSIVYTYTNGDGCSDTVMQQTEVELCDGINGNSAAALISVFPNPFDGTIQLTGLPNGLTEFEILDIMGRQVKHLIHTSGSSTHLELGFLPTGVYTLVVRTKSSLIYKRIVKH